MLVMLGSHTSHTNSLKRQTPLAGEQDAAPPPSR